MMSAYAGDTSQEAKAKLQTLTVQLQDAEEELANTQYERQLSDQQAIFDHLYQSLEDYFNDKLEKPEDIIDETRNYVSDNLPTIKKSLINSVGKFTKISNTLDNIFNSGIGDLSNKISTLDGDIRAISSSVTAQTTDLTEYLTRNNLELQKQETIYSRIEALYGKDNAKSLEHNFSLFNTKMDSIIAAINKTDAKAIEDQQIETIKNYQGTDLEELLQQIGYKDGGEKVSKNVWLAIKDLLVNGGRWRIPTDTLKAIKKRIYGKAKGDRRIGSDMTAWTQENGLEAILRPTDNAILTPLKAGDAVLNAQATQNIWDMANNPLQFIKDTIGLPSGAIKGANVTFQNSFDLDLNLPNVTDYASFMRELQKNKQFEAMIQDMTVKQMNGGSGLAKLKYRF